MPNPAVTSLYSGAKEGNASSDHNVFHLGADLPLNGIVGLNGYGASGYLAKHD
jgi:hypothetical protein